MATKEEHYQKGLELIGEGKHEEAIEEYKKAIEADPNDDEVHLALSMSYQQLGKLDDALESARKAVDLAPRDPLGYTNLSRILQKKGMIAEAEEAMAISRQISTGMM